MEATQVAVFTIKDYVCGIETDRIKTIIRHQQSDKIKGAPGYVEGVIKWRDESVPVINLAAKLGLGIPEVTKKTKILIVEIHNRFAGFTVDDVNIIQKYSAHEIEQAPPILAMHEKGYLKAVGKSGGRLVPVLDFQKLLTSSELKRIDRAMHMAIH